MILNQSENTGKKKVVLEHINLPEIFLQEEKENGSIFRFSHFGVTYE